MTEKERDIRRQRFEDIKDYKTGAATQDIEYAETTYIRADIARQLTIANEIAVRRHQVEYASAQQKNPDIIYEVDPPIDLDKLSPADDGLTEVDQAYRKRMNAATPDDALVEAVEDILILATNLKTGNIYDTTDPKYLKPFKTGIFRERLQKLKAAHKQAVR